MIVVVHFEVSLTIDLSNRFSISSITILNPRWGEKSRNEKPRNIMQDKHEVTARSHMGRLKRAMPKGSRAFVLKEEEGNIVSRCKI
jgi:hypothetical protein